MTKIYILAFKAMDFCHIANLNALMHWCILSRIKTCNRFISAMCEQYSTISYRTFKRNVILPRTFVRFKYSIWLHSIASSVTRCNSNVVMDITRRYCSYDVLQVDTALKTVGYKNVYIINVYMIEFRCPT